MSRPGRKTRCRFFDDDGTPQREGCRNGDNCTWAHPTMPEWENARPASREQRGRPRGDGPPRGYNSSYQSGWGDGDVPAGRDSRGPPRHRDSGYGGRRSGANERDSSHGKTSYTGGGGWNGGGWDASGDSGVKNDTASTNGWGSTDWGQVATTNDTLRPDNEPLKSNWGHGETKDDNPWAQGASKDGWGNSGTTWGNTGNESPKWNGRSAEDSRGSQIKSVTGNSTQPPENDTHGWAGQSSWNQPEPEAFPRQDAASTSTRSWDNSAPSISVKDDSSSTIPVGQATSQGWDPVMADRERQPSFSAESIASQHGHPEPSESGSRKAGSVRELDVRNSLEPPTPTCKPYVLDDDEKFISVLVLNSMEVIDEIEAVEEELKDIRTLKTTAAFQRLSRAGCKDFVALFTDIKRRLAVARSKQKAYLDALAEIEPDPAGAIDEFKNGSQSREGSGPSGDQSLNYLNALSQWIDDLETPLRTFEARLDEHEANVDRQATTESDAAQDQPKLEDLEDEMLRLKILVDQNQDCLDAVHDGIRDSYFEHVLNTFIDNKLLALHDEDEGEEGEYITDTGFIRAQTKFVRVAEHFEQLTVTRTRVVESGVSEAVTALENEIGMLADEVRETEASWDQAQQQAAALQVKITQAQEKQQARSREIMIGFIDQTIMADVVPEMEKVSVALRKRFETQTSDGLHLMKVLNQADSWITKRRAALSTLGTPNET